MCNIALASPPWCVLSVALSLLFSLLCVLSAQCSIVQHTTRQQREITTKEIKNRAFQRFAQSMLRLILKNMLPQSDFPHAYLNFSFEFGSVQQGHFEWCCFESLGAFLGRFEGFVWGHLLRHVIRFFVFVQMLGVLFLKIFKKRQRNDTGLD